MACEKYFSSFQLFAKMVELYFALAVVFLSNVNGKAFGPPPMKIDHSGVKVNLIQEKTTKV